MGAMAIGIPLVFVSSFEQSLPGWSPDRDSTPASRVATRWPPRQLPVKGGVEVSNERGVQNK